MKTKICSNCKVEKDVCEFGLDKSRKDGLNYKCRSCVSNYDKNRYDKKSEEIKNNTKNYYNNNKEKVNTINKLWVSKNPEKVKEIKNNWYKNNPEKVSLIKKKYRIKNKEVIKQKNKEYNLKNKNKRRLYEKEKRISDNFYKLKNNIRHRINLFLKTKNIKKNNKTFDIVGCSPEFLREYIEKQFKNGMSWDNYGFYGWHIDHIIPLSSGNTEEEFYKLCHYTNLQPLWAEDNLKKSNKIII